jgi:hypothetical protein
MESVKGWLEGSGYARGLGVQLASLSQEAAELRLPFREQNSNPARRCTAAAPRPWR